MSGNCVNTPLNLDDDDDDVYFKIKQQYLIDSLARYEHGVTTLRREPVDPLTSFSLLFGVLLDVGIQRRVQQSYVYALSTKPETGWIYVFRDVRDQDAYIVKIGSTTGPVHKRIAQWRRDLGNAHRNDVVLLFKARTFDVRLAEYIIHRLLFCQWLPKRVNLLTGRRLLEYFRVENLPALRLLLPAVCRHVDWYTTITYQQRTSLTLIV